MPLLKQVSLHAANVMGFFLPQSRAYGLKNVMYRSAGVKVGAGVKINGTARIHYPNVRIGARTWIGPANNLIPTQGCEVRVGEDCDLAPGVTLASGSHVIAGSARRAGDGSKSEAVVVGDGTWVGTNVTFIAGAEVGKGCVVAAGAVVTRKFGDNLLVGGIPARVIRKLD